MPSWHSSQFPLLGEIEYCETSPKTRQYNCIAWAAGDTSKKWWPDPLNIGYWPPNIPRAETVACFVSAYGTLGYVPCGNDGSAEPGFEKVALFAEKGQSGSWKPTHAAISTINGCWSSKLGDFEDIEHFRVESLHGQRYGAVVCYLSRPRQPRPATRPGTAPARGRPSAGSPGQ